MDNPPGLPRIFSEEDVARMYEHVGVTVRLVRAHRKSGRLKHVSFSHRKFGFPEEAIVSWLAALTIECHDVKQTKYLNIGDGGSSACPTVRSGMEQAMMREAEESAARALARTISKPPKMH
jgi:hypothetical protein